jgi:hypothetical protein
MRPIGTSYGLSQNWNESYLEFRNGGSNLDARYPNGTGRELYLNFFAEKDVYLGSPFGTQNTYVLGHLRVQETVGTPPTQVGGSLTLQHNNIGGTSSIVFTNKANASDYGYISYTDDVGYYPENNQSILEIGIKNDGDGANVDNIALMPSGYVGINTRNPETNLDVDGNTNISGNLKLGSIANVEDAINNAGGVPSITYDPITQTTTFDGSFIVIPTDIDINLGPAIPDLYTHLIFNVDARIENLQATALGLKIDNNTFIQANLTEARNYQLSIRPENDVEDAIMELYSKNGTAELKIGDYNGTALTFANVLKSENENATFYGNNGSETKYMEYNSTDDKINLFKDMDLGTNNLTFNKGVIREVVGTEPSAVGGGSLTLIHDNSGGTSSIVFKSAKDSTDRGYISYIDDISGDTIRERSLLEIGCQNDGAGTNVDNISLMPSGFVGVNTRIPQTTLDVNGEIGCNGMTMNNVIIGERTYNNTDGAGIMVRTLDNPSNNLSGSGSIFEVQSQINSKRLWVGNNLTSSGSNKFLFGFNNTYGQEGLETNYSGRLNTDGSVECIEIKVNQMPINSFTNYKIGSNFDFGTWGKGNQIIYQQIPVVPPITSHGTLQFAKTGDNLSFTCLKVGTYEITANVIFRNTGTTRENPCIAIGINADTNLIIGTEIGPNWDITPYNQSPFAVAYVRYGEGKVCSLTAKRTHHFINTTDLVAVKTYIESGSGDTFQGTQNIFTILNATIQFKYIGNFNSIS